MHSAGTTVGKSIRLIFPRRTQEGKERKQACGDHRMFDQRYAQVFKSSFVVYCWENLGIFWGGRGTNTITI